MELSAVNPESDQGVSKVHLKAPKRVLHFSDGTLEEYSDDETDNSNANKEPAADLIDPKSLNWPQWISYKAWSAGVSTLNAVDYVGETLAEFFGITTPKYQYEIDEYKRLEEEKKKREEEAKGWTTNDTEGLTTTQPVAEPV